MTSNQCYDKKTSIVQWRNGSGNNSSNALPTSIAVIPTSIVTYQPHNTRSRTSQTLSINGKSPKNSYVGRARIGRHPSLVFEGISGPLSGCVTTPTSPRVTAMGVATTVNATAEAIFSQQIAASHNSEVNCRSDGATPTPPTQSSSDLPEFILRPNHSNLIRGSSSYGPPSLIREDSVLNSLECWDYSVELECLQGPDDLQLAAELGKTLLERNKELENSLKEQQAIIDDQAQEIEYLTKQTTTLREINDSRVKIYEQLEVSIADLEATNKQLVEESKADKNRIKSLCTNINRLDARCEDLQRCLDEARHLVETSERKNKSVNQKSSIDVEKKISRSESSKNVKTSSFSPTVNGISNCTMPLQEESSCPNNSNLSSNIPNEIKSAKNGDEQNKSVDNHSLTTSSQEYNLRVPSLNHELELNSYSGTHGNRQWNLDSTNSQMFSSLPNSDEISHAKSEDSGYENGELSDKCYDTRKSDSDTFQNVTSSSSSSCSPQPKSSSSGSRVGSAFSDSPLESEEPISLGAVSSSFQNNVGSTQILSNNDEVRVNGDNTAPIQHSIALSLKKAAEAMMGKSVKSTVYSHQQMNGNITNLEMEESTNTVNEMERAISDLRAENLKLKLDLGGERNDDESASIDESLLSVDEEVQEVTAVRMGKLCRRCLGINDATPGILIDKAMDLMGETLVSELQDYFGSSSSNWVQHMKSSRVWLDAWLAGVCACAFLIALLRRAFDVSSSITYDLAEAWFNS